MKLYYYAFFLSVHPVHRNSKTHSPSTLLQLFTENKILILKFKIIAPSNSKKLNQAQIYHPKWLYNIMQNKRMSSDSKTLKILIWEIWTRKRGYQNGHKLNAWKTENKKTGKIPPQWPRYISPLSTLIRVRSWFYIEQELTNHSETKKLFAQPAIPLVNSHFKVNQSQQDKEIICATSNSID